MPALTHAGVRWLLRQRDAHRARGEVLSGETIHRLNKFFDPETLANVRIGRDRLNS